MRIISWMIFAVRLGINLLQQFFFNFMCFVEYYDCALIGGFSYVFLRAIFDTPNWIAIIVALSLIALFFALYKMKIGYRVLSIGFSALWGYIFSRLAVWGFKLDNIWFWVLLAGFALVAWYAHGPLDVKRQAHAEADAEFYGYES